MAKSTFSPLRLPAGAVTASDINRIQDLIDAGFKDLASKIPTASAAPKPTSSGIVTLTSNDGSVILTPSSGTGASVDLSAADADVAQIVVTATSTVDLLTVAGLDGDNDGDYEINGYLIQPGTSGANWYVCQINGDNTNSYQNAFGNPIVDGLALGNNNTGVTVCFHGFISSKSGKERYMEGRNGRGQGGSNAGFTCACTYTNATPNITSLVFRDNTGTNQIAAGSFVQVRKLRNKY